MENSQEQSPNAQKTPKQLLNDLHFDDSTLVKLSPEALLALRTEVLEVRKQMIGDNIESGFVDATTYYNQLGEIIRNYGFPASET